MSLQSCWSRYVKHWWVGWVDNVETRGPNGSIPQHCGRAHVKSRTQSRSGRVVGVASGPEGNGGADMVDPLVDLWVDNVDPGVDIVDPQLVDTIVVSKLASLTNHKGFTGTQTS